MKTVMVVDDDPHILDVICFALEKADMRPIRVSDGADAVTMAASDPPDLVVLDVMMPGLDGLETCRQLRRTSDVPILFLSSRDEEVDRIIGLEIGGDDYVTKPFSPRELVARINVILRRARPAPAAPDREETLSRGRIVLNRSAFTASFDGAAVPLTATEFNLLATLMRYPGRVARRDDLIDGAYGHNIHVSDRTIDSHIRHVRGKFTDAGCQSVIETVHGVGYRLGPCT